MVLVETLSRDPMSRTVWCVASNTIPNVASRVVCQRDASRLLVRVASLTRRAKR